MEKFIEEVQAYCKRSGRRIAFVEDGNIIERDIGHAFISNHGAKSLAALIREGLGERRHKELLEACREANMKLATDRLLEAMKASSDCLSKTEKARDGN